MCITVFSSSLGTWYRAQLRVGTDVCAQSMAARSVTCKGRRGMTGSLLEEGARLWTRLWTWPSPAFPGPKREGAQGLLVGISICSRPGRSPVTSSGHSGLQPHEVFQRVREPESHVGQTSEQPQAVSDSSGTQDSSTWQDVGFWVLGPRQGEVLGHPKSARAGLGRLLRLQPVCCSSPGSGPTALASAP